MIDDLLPLLQCVECRSPRLARSARAAERPALRCAACGAEFPIDEGIVRMVPRGSALRGPSRLQEQALTLDDGLQAAYWEDEGHAFRSPEHPIVQFFARQRWAYLARRLDLASLHTALDVGCGDGFSTLYAPPHLEVTACDGSLTMLRRHRGARRVQADAFRLPFQDDAFDLAFCWELLHHVSEPRRVLGEMARVARRWVVVCEPNPLNPAQFAFSWYDRAHRWVLRYSQRYLRRQAEAAGLEVVHFARCGWIFPNKTPLWMFHAVKHLPYRMPLVGITSLLAARCDRAKREATAAGGPLAARGARSSGRAA